MKFSPTFTGRDRSKAKVVIIGTEHGSDFEREIFEYLNSSTHLYWLCEGESDFRRCSSIKNYSVHLFTDSLFVFMIVCDLISFKNPSQHFLQQELIDRLIEFLISLCRLPDNHRGLQKRITNLLISRYTEFSQCLSILSMRPLTQGQLQQVEKIIKKQGLMENLYYFRSLLKRIIILVMYSGFVYISRHLETRVIQFLVNPRKCSDCENLIFTKLRERSFIEIITDSLQQYELLPDVTVITVGNDHVEPLKTALSLRFPFYKIVAFSKTPHI